MWRGFIIFIEIVLLVMILRSSFVQYMLSDVQAVVGDWFSDLSEAPSREMLASLKDEVAPMLVHLNDTQRSYILEGVISSSESVNQFYSYYCISDNLNPFLKPPQRYQLCVYLRGSLLLDSHLRSG